MSIQDPAVISSACMTPTPFCASVLLSKQSMVLISPASFVRDVCEDINARGDGC